MTEEWKRALGRIIGTVGQIRNDKMQPLTWFLCFGSLLKFMRDGKIDSDDIDLGIFYEEYSQKVLENAFVAAGLQIRHKIVHDKDKKPLYYSLKDPYAGIHCCIFCWYKHKNLRYHTYDVNMEKKDIPSKYVFKGVPAEILECKLIEKPIPDIYRSVKVPLAYGALWDIWYPDWHEKRKGSSQTKWQIEMKSCKQFETEFYTKMRTKWDKHYYIDGKLCE